MNPQSTSLDLRDIHLPDGISWWPPAPGWWLLLITISIIIAVGMLLYRRNKARRIHRAAAQELTRIEMAYADHADDQQLVQALSIWLRRVCLSFYPRVDVAGLTGRAWLEFLDKGLSRNKPAAHFSEGAGQVLISAPYQQSITVNADELLSICRSWLINLPRNAPQTQVQP